MAMLSRNPQNPDYTFLNGYSPVFLNMKRYSPIGSFNRRCTAPGGGGEEPVQESKDIDLDAMRSLALEAGCDDELLMLLEDFKTKDHFNKQDEEEQSK